MSLTRRKFVQLFATLVATLALSLALAPSAFAAIVTGNISAKVDGNIAATYGDTISVANSFEESGCYIDEALTTLGTKGTDYHFDYFIATADSAKATVNKHNGTMVVNYDAFTQEDGTLLDTIAIEVEGWLINGAPPSGNGNGGGSGTGSGSGSTNPCNPSINPDTGYMSKASVTVTVDRANAYTFQGGDNAIKMIDPTVAMGNWSYDSDTNTYTNNIGTVTASGNYYYFTYQTAAGFNSHNTAELYQIYETGLIHLYRSDGHLVNSLGDSNSKITVDSVDASAKTVTLKVRTNAIPTAFSGGYLVFDPGLKANNEDKILGSTVIFNFTK